MKGEVRQDLVDSLNEYIWIKEFVRAVRNVQVGYSENAQIILKKCIIKGHYFETMKWLLIAKLPHPIYLFIKDIRQN